MDEHTAAAGGESARGRRREPVGTLGEEAVKLLGVASAWARAQQSDEAHPGEVPDPSQNPCPSCGSATGDACTRCAICQAAAFVRSADAEFGAALSSSVVSLTDLARTVLDSLAAHEHRHQRQRRYQGADAEEDDPWG